MRYFLILLGVMLMAAQARAGDAYDTALNRWSAACGAVERQRDGWSFGPGGGAPCNGGTGAQLQSGRIASDREGAYLLRTTLSVAAPRAGAFTLFSVAAADAACATPLALEVAGGGALRATTRSGPGCRPVDIDTGARLRLDGAQQRLDILIVFDGQGGVDAVIRLDGARIARAGAASDGTAFALRFGMAQAKAFDFAMTTTGPTVRSMAGRL